MRGALQAEPTIGVGPIEGRHHKDRGSGVIVMPATVGRTRQQQLARTIIGWISSAAAAQERPDEFMLGMLIEIDEAGTCSATPLPPNL